MCEISIDDINGSDKYPDARTIGRKFEPFSKLCDQSRTSARARRKLSSISVSMGIKLIVL